MLIKKATSACISHGKEQVKRKFAWFPKQVKEGIVWLDFYYEKSVYIAGIAPFEHLKKNGRWLWLERSYAAIDDNQNV